MREPANLRRRGALSHSTHAPAGSSGLAVWRKAFALMLVVVTTTWTVGSAQSSPGTPLLFGVINNDGRHYADEWARGVRATTFELQWKRYEPQEGVYDTAYIRSMQDLLRQLKTQGWYVQLVPGYHYVPDWVFTRYPDMHFINQYGDPYDSTINAPFNPQARALIAGYIARIFQDFNSTDFDSVRVGGGTQGELRYPPPDWNNHTKCYWAFDRHAQNPSESGIPAQVIGWRPGIDPNPGSVGRGQLIINPSFEQTHTYLLIPGWSAEYGMATEFIAASSPKGNRALKLTIGIPHRVHQFVRVQPSTPYNFGGLLISGDGAGHAQAFFNQYDANSQLVPGASLGRLETNAPTWTSLSSTLITSATTRFLKVELDGDKAGAYYFDDMWLKREGEANNEDRDMAVPLAFYDWYARALTNYQNWQIAEIRKYYQGQLDVLYAGKGLMPDHLTDALTNDLQGDGWSEKISALYAGATHDRHVAGLTTTQNIALYLTGVEEPSADKVDDTSLFPGDWSAARWIAHLAHSRGLAVWGENSGQGDVIALELSARRMWANGFLGLMWAFESELYANPDPNHYATISDYAAHIVTYSNPHKIFLPLLYKSVF